MSRLRPLRIVLGVLCWLAVAGGALWLAADEAHWAPAQAVLARSVAAPRALVLDFEQPVALQPGDRAYLETRDALAPLGEVARVETDGPRTRVTLWPAPGMETAVGPRHRFYLADSPVAAAAVLGTLLGAPERAVIERELAAFFADHEPLIRAELEPWLAEVGERFAAVVEGDARAALARHQAALTALIERHWAADWAPQIAPLFNAEVWPGLQDEGTPLVRDITAALWKEFGLVEFGARRVFLSPFVSYDTDADYFAWFWKQKAKPILAAHEGELRELLARTLRNAADNERLRQFVQDRLAALLADEELHALLKTALTECVIENPRVVDFLRDTALDPALRDFLGRLGTWFEPYLYRINNALLLDRQGDGINPHLAKVLRAQVFGKRERWLLARLAPAPDEAPAVGAPALPVGVAAAWTDAH